MYHGSHKQLQQREKERERDWAITLNRGMESRLIEGWCLIGERWMAHERDKRLREQGWEE